MPSRGRGQGDATVICPDTNVLIRYFTHDDPVQYERADMAIEGLSKSRPGYLTVTVLTQVHWALRHRYRQDAETVASVMLGPWNPDVISPSPSTAPPRKTPECVCFPDSRATDTRFRSTEACTVLRHEISADHGR